MRCFIRKDYQLDGEPFSDPPYVEVMLTAGRLSSAIRMSPRAARKLSRDLNAIAIEVEGLANSEERKAKSE
jgi:hypothetical protein